MSKKPRILVVGSFVMDVIATTERIPKSAQTVYGNSFHMAPGGKGANQALQCARLGADVTMMGCVGDDLFGELLLKTPQEAGVDVSHVVVRQGIHSGGGGQMRREGEGNSRIQHSIVGDHGEVVHGVFVVGLCVGDHSGGCCFAAGTGGGGNGDQRREPAADF